MPMKIKGNRTYSFLLLIFLKRVVLPHFGWEIPDKELSMLVDCILLALAAIFRFLATHRLKISMIELKIEKLKPK